MANEMTATQVGALAQYFHEKFPERQHLVRVAVMENIEVVAEKVYAELQQRGLTVSRFQLGNVQFGTEIENGVLPENDSNVQLVVINQDGDGPPQRRALARTIEEFSLNILTYYNKRVVVIVGNASFSIPVLNRMVDVAYWN